MKIGYKKPVNLVALPVASVLGLLVALLALREFAPSEYRRMKAWVDLAWVETGSRLWHGKPETDILPLPRMTHIAHAGGGIDGRTYTNSKQALDFNYQRGFRLFEVDIQWTTDGQLVLVHDWREEAHLFNGREGPFSHADFLAIRMEGGLTQLGVDGLMEWLSAHPDAYIITDVKRKNVAALKRIWEQYPFMRKNIIPQIYYFREYHPVRAIGYDKIILTLYSAGYRDGPVVAFLGRNPLSAVTIPLSRGFSALPARLTKAGIPVFVHTVNDPEVVRKLREHGVAAVYTDFLSPRKASEALLHAFQLAN